MRQLQCAANAVGAVSLFALGRIAASSFLENGLGPWPLLEGIRSQLSDPSMNTRINLLLCFVPIPYGVHVYAFSCTPVGELAHAGESWCCSDI